MTKKSSVIRILGMAATAIGMVATLLSDWVTEQRMNEKIDEKVNEALATRKEEEES